MSLAKPQIPLASLQTPTSSPSLSSYISWTL